MKNINLFYMLFIVLCIFVSNFYSDKKLSNNNENLTIELNDYSIYSNTTNAAVDSPIVLTKLHNVAVEYNWDSCNNDAKLEYCYDYENYIPLNQRYFKNIVFANEYNSKRCDDRRYYQFRSYNTVIDEYSNYTTLESNCFEPGYIRYGVDCLYELQGQFQYSRFLPTQLMPTDFDQEYCIWNHNSNVGHTIKCSIMYNNEISDVEINIPWIGYTWASVQVDNFEFELRSGPWKFSLRSKQNNVLGMNIKFGWSVI